MRPLKKQNHSQSVSLPRARAAGTVRIISGKWRRTPLAVADFDGLRPTGDRIRETLFNWLNYLLGDYSEIEGLDMFAGSGALGFELASRGARGVTLLEKNRRVYEKLCLSRTKLRAENILDIRCADALTDVRSLNKKYDIIFIDPPFALNLHEKAIKLALSLLKENGFIYIESPKEWDAQILADLKLTVVRESETGAVAFRLVSPIQEEK